MGALPLEIGKLNNLQGLDISDNKLSGHIPSTLGNCLKLESLRLEGNMFQGSIPLSFSSLRGIEILNLSRNNLSGRIEEYLAALMFLENLNLSFNNLAGELPLQGVFGNLSVISLAGNKGLCGGSAEMQLPTCPKSVRKGNRLGFKVIVAIACMIPYSQMLFKEPKEARNDVDQNEKIRQAKVRECLMSLMRIGVACSAESPGERMNVKDALVGLMTIKEVFLGVGIHGKRHSCEGTSRACY
ncbi:hypothetical protein RHSIM_Rhsim09G0174800 [Rhododendron simsii]|uniref:Uncharacterized protein n=1 Tax=Rhododendron simsii TaxID=118357 RepID=A0A834GGM6_RHOSS|nr:hypothetical protein RHSIM_Rhsim09G0174800 [Rhododendron simsii]